MRLRPYRQGDANKIVTWCKDEESFYKWSAGKLDGYPVSVKRMEEATSGRLDNDKYFPFTAFDENGVVGFFTLRQPDENRDELRFGFVIIDPVIRGKGYGKKMLWLGLKYAFEIYGTKKVGLGVFDNNPSAYHCYKSVGFQETGETEMYSVLGQEWKCVVMEVDEVVYNRLRGLT